ncbi:MAG: hypothetical protein KBC27_02190 [Rickettsiales bacterium]|nr:hypothetical protein [Rickettsiales bacterium]
MPLSPEQQGAGFLSKILGFTKGLFKGVWQYAPESIKQRFTEGGVWSNITVVFGFFKNIYFLITIPAIVVVYKLYMVLKEKGIIAQFQDIVINVTNMVMYIANECFPLILNLRTLSSCVANAPLA